MPVTVQGKSGRSFPPDYLRGFSPVQDTVDDLAAALKAGGSVVPILALEGRHLEKLSLETTIAGFGKLYSSSLGQGANTD